MCMNWFFQTQYAYSSYLTEQFSTIFSDFDLPGHSHMKQPKRLW